MLNVFCLIYSVVFFFDQIFLSFFISWIQFVLLEENDYGFIESYMQVVCIIWQVFVFVDYVVVYEE